MNERRPHATAIVLSALLACTLSVQASLHLTVENGLHFQINEAFNNNNSSDLAELLGVNDLNLGSFLYKDNFDQGTEKGLPLAFSYATQYVPDADGDILIDYIPGQPVADATFLVVKSGKVGGTWVWNLQQLNWNGSDQIIIEDPFIKGSTSHVGMWGRTAVVPEPTTLFAGSLLLLPFVFRGLRRLRQMLR